MGWWWGGGMQGGRGWQGRAGRGVVCSPGLCRTCSTTLHSPGFTKGAWGEVGRWHGWLRCVQPGLRRTSPTAQPSVASQNKPSHPPTPPTPGMVRGTKPVTRPNPRAQPGVSQRLHSGSTKPPGARMLEENVEHRVGINVQPQLVLLRSPGLPKQTPAAPEAGPPPNGSTAAAKPIQPPPPAR